ncbi:ParB-like protein [Variovorax robiniae]|uniref:ParB-like protein n=1 Tax=Variovorax robiniae TaxID=1836199 RepID=A0ABU8XJ98_9BURK
MRNELFPAVIGPKKTYYILDHHHAAVALVQEKSDRVAVGVAKDLSHLKPASFWIFLDHFSWVHPYDDKGRRRPFDDMPDTFEQLKDDPFRSLAADVLEAGGFAKPDEPYVEFLWANFFRDEMAAKSADHPGKALSKARRLAKSKAE